MQIPCFAKPQFQAYQNTGTLAGQPEKTELSREDAETALQGMKDDFTRWKSLDETDADLAKGTPGEVRLRSPYSAEESTTATFSGDTQNGELQVFQNEPSHMYGAVGFSSTRFTPQAAEEFHIRGMVGTDHLFGPTVTHVDRQLASDGPISLGGGPVTVTLHDHAQSGYYLRA